MEEKKKLIIEINKKLHQQIKIRAAKKGMTIKDWVHVAISHYQAYERSLGITALSEEEL